MAIAHYAAKIISRGKGQSVIESLAYVDKQQKFDERLQQQTRDYLNQQNEIKERELVLPQRVRELARGRYDGSDGDQNFWNDIEASEKRKDAQLAQRIDFAVPRELNTQQQRELCHDFFTRLAEREGRGSSWALHDVDGHNPHPDAILTLRAWDKDIPGEWGRKGRPQEYILDKDGNRIPTGKGGHARSGWKKTPYYSYNGPDFLNRCRKLYQDTVNEHLERAGLAQRIDVRKLSVQLAEQLQLASAAEQRGDLDAMQRHAEAAIQLDRIPQKKEPNPDSLNAQKNRANKKTDAERQKKNLDALHKAVKRHKHDEHFRRVKERGERTRRTRRELARRNGIKTTDPHELGRVLMHGRKQLDARRTTRSFLQELGAGGKQQRYDIAIYTDPQQLMRDNPSVTPTQLANAVFNRRWPAYEQMCKQRGWQITPAKKDKLRHKIAQDIRKGKLKDVFVVARSAKQAANVGAKVAVVSLGVTRKMLECIQSVARCIPILGKFFSAAVGAAKSPLDAAHKAAKSLDKATRERDERQDERKQPRQRGGQQRQERQGGQQQQQQRDESQRDDRGGLPASSAEAREEHNNGLDKWSLLSSVARADKEMEDFLAEVFGGGRGHARRFGE